MSALAQEVILKSQEPLVYAQRFGLSRDPFHDEGVEGLFYPGAGRQDCLDRLHHLSRYGHFLVHVVADLGAGKTHLARIYYAQAQERACRISYIDTPVMMGPDQMMRVMVKGFGIALDENDTVLRILEKLFSFAQQLKPQLVEMVCIVDDAHQLAADSLALLLSIVERAKGEKIGIHIVMLAETQFTKLLSQPQLKELFEQHSYPMMLRPLNEGEIREYIEYRLRTAGYASGFPFSDKLLRQLFQQSKGMPQRANQLASRLLVQQAVQSSQKSWGLPPVHLASVVVVGALLLALMFWNQEGRVSKSEHQSSQVTADTAPEEAFLSKQKLLSTAQPGSGSELETSNTEQKPPIATVAELRRLAKPESMIEPSVAQTKEVFEAGSKSSPAVGEAGDLNNVQTFATRPQPALQSQSGAERGAPRALVQQVSGVKKAVVSGSVAGNDDGVEVVPSSRLKARVSNRGGWLRSRDPEHFTLQLLGAHNYGAVKSFIENNKGVGELAQFSTSREGQRWYVIVYGDYANRDAAVQAIPNLPNSFQVLKPWVRSFASVQNDLGRRSEN